MLLSLCKLQLSIARPPPAIDRNCPGNVGYVVVLGASLRSSQPQKVVRPRHHFPSLKIWPSSIHSLLVGASLCVACPDLSVFVFHAVPNVWVQSMILSCTQAALGPRAVGSTLAQLGEEAGRSKGADYVFES